MKLNFKAFQDCVNMLNSAREGKSYMLPSEIAKKHGMTIEELCDNNKAIGARIKEELD